MTYEITKSEAMSRTRRIRQQKRKKSKRKRIMEGIRFKFSMELRRVQSKWRRKCQRISCKIFGASTKINRKAIPEN
jgi:hypothetical protein